MIHKLIQTENYLLVVDESEIKYDDHFIDEYKMLYMLKNGSIETYKSAKKVITHLPLNNSPILEGVDLLPPLEDEVEKLAESMLPKEGIAYRKWVKMLIIAGYNKAKEKYKYTEEDLSKALSYGYHTAKDEAKGIPSSGYFTRFIQSLQQPKMPVGFKCETIDEAIRNLDEDINGTNAFRYEPKLKTTTNLQGLTQWVGKYVY